MSKHKVKNHKEKNLITLNKAPEVQWEKFFDEEHRKGLYCLTITGRSLRVADYHREYVTECWCQFDEAVKKIYDHYDRYVVGCYRVLDITIYGSTRRQWISKEADTTLSNATLVYRGQLTKEVIEKLNQALENI